MQKSAEIIERKNGFTMWQRGGAEGGLEYGYSRDRDGIAVEPKSWLADYEAACELMAAAMGASADAR